MASISSEFHVTCPCCHARLTVDAHLQRVLRHETPPRADQRSLDAVQDILAAEEARREALFEESRLAEATRADSLAKRFEDALRQAQDEPITKPTRAFDLD